LTLSIRPATYSLPSYSLTGDLLGFMRCGLQYRYTRIGQLPSSRPVQMWFGSFVHGVFEEAYRQYAAALSEGRNDLPPWSDERLEELCNLIQRRLAAQRLFPWTEDLEKLGKARAKAAINDLGPSLFPIIHRAEVRLTGTRTQPLQLIPSQLRFRAADRYEMVGVIDVITHIELSDLALQNNRLIQMIAASLPGSLPDRFEVIIDYKGMRRPPQVASTTGPSYWDIYAWQVQTYAHLRSTHEDSLPVVAGIIIYLNELLPTASDLRELRKEMTQRTTDVPLTDPTLIQQLDAFVRRSGPAPVLPLADRLQRALRIVPISQNTIDQSLLSFDDVVARIERCRGQELRAGQVIPSWEKNPADEDTCTVCDARTFCPSYTKENTPRLPGVRA